MQEKAAKNQDPPGFTHWKLWDDFFQLQNSLTLGFRIRHVLEIPVQILPMPIHVHTHSSYSCALNQAWSRGQQRPQQCRTVVVCAPKLKDPSNIGTKSTSALEKTVQRRENWWTCCREEVPALCHLNYTREEKEVILHLTCRVADRTLWTHVLCFTTHNIKVSQSHL